MATEIKALTANPFLKWAGGKSALAPQIVDHFVQRQGRARFDVWYQPFLGGGQPYWELYNRDLTPPEVHLSDVDAELVLTYQQVRDAVCEVADALRVMEQEYRAFPEAFHYSMRNLDPATLQSDERAARFILLNHTGYNGLQRTNKAGKSNVPWCHNPTVHIWDMDTLFSSSDALFGVTIEQISYEGIRDHWRSFKADRKSAYYTPSAFAYFDPPYVPLSATSSFTSYSAGGFSMLDQINLMWFCHNLEEEGITWLQTNSDSPITRALYQTRTTTTALMRRSINSKPTLRGRINELIITP